MNKTYTLIGIAVLVAGLSIYALMAYTSHTTQQTAQVASTVATSTTTLPGAATGTIKVYSSPNASFSSPQQFVSNINSENQMIVSMTQGGKTSFVEVYAAKTGDCYMDFCKAPVQSTSEQNGVTWEFLGNPEHCDAKECSQPSALYRTKTATKDIYLVFFEYGPHINKAAIFSTFAVK